MRIHALAQPPSLPLWVKILFGTAAAGLLGLFAGPAFGLLLLTGLPVVLMFVPWAALAMWRGGHQQHRPHDYPGPTESARAFAVVDYLDRQHLKHA